MIKKINRIVQLTASDWGYLTIAIVELLIARIRHARVSAETIIRDLQALCTPNFGWQQTKQTSAIDLQRLSWAIAVAASRVPWRSDCVLQAMAADRWMRRHNLRPVFYLGVAKDARGNLRSHAWLRYGDTTVTGGEYEEFSVLIGPSVDRS
jgi:hypothetical protein